ncbi:MAG: DNA ligase D [Armatimonadetes bacterium]|nr:DNA ligase D [Armatimonadota bacterium]
MPLESYARKRRFQETPEPPPRIEKEEGRRFCVQRHDARALHYDFRLEADGVLVSWAIPRGPSLDPKSKRRAAHTEDHPVDYLEFEGVIPEGNYGAGSVMLWDLGTYDLIGDMPFSGQHERGEIKFALHGEKLNGEFVFVKTSAKDWLLIKKKDVHARPGFDVESLARSVKSGLTQVEIARGETGSERTRQGEISRAAAKPEAEVVSRKFPGGARERPFPTAIKPMLAVSGEAFDDPRWHFELKWDGLRVLSFCRDGRLQLTSRLGNSMNVQFPELAALHSNVKGASFVLDGEVVALNERGAPDFQKLQPRMHLSSAGSAARLAKTTPATYMVFDLLYLDGHDLRGVPFEERRKLLEQVLVPDQTVRISEAIPEQGKTMFAFAAEHGLEGIVAKRRDSVYEERRSKCWIKVKSQRTIECVVAGLTAPKGGRTRFGALVLGLYERGELVHAGNVGSGFSQKALDAHAKELGALAQEQCPFPHCPKIDGRVQWLRPETVCEVRFTEWSAEGHLRHPVFLRMRPDKSPLECTRDEGEPPAAGRAVAPEERNDSVVVVEGRELKLTNLDKVLFPRDGITKRDVINFYDRIADFILPHLRDRFLTMKRFPNGIHQPFFFQRHAKEHFPPWMTTIENDEGEENPVCSDRASLIYLANLACIDQNVRLSRVQSPDQPDFILIDLDPQEKCPFDTVIEAALLMREILEQIGLEGFPKTSGGRGLHVYVPIAGGYDFDQTRTIAHVLTRIGSARRPDLFTLPRVVARRETSKVYVDHPHNRAGSTISAPYVLRAHDGAPVATPLTWDELVPGLKPRGFNIHTVFERLEARGDLFAPVLEHKQRLEEPIARLDRLVRGEG